MSGWAAKNGIGSEIRASIAPHIGGSSSSATAIRIGASSAVRDSAGIERHAASTERPGIGAPRAHIIGGIGRTIA